ncbi:threonine aldolase family protein [Amycolatopsis anabasis]|uniref:threonine aldolase family protein n=1 Tax=Amycolatopsis anabasis TaxID=1840409 RepID=UPI00131A9AB8|nr:beta-eliminating lyase-related protein [Amycolatopsis anabasis]
MRFLSHHRRRTSREWLDHLRSAPGADERPDKYNEGPALRTLEREVAALLGKPAGRFVIKGVMAQQALLRVWTERRCSPVVALHRRSHIELDEDAGFQRLHGLRPARLADWEPFTVADLDAVAERIGAVVVELPIRRAGHRLPGWTELVAISEWCRERAVPLHFDGARLWECAPHYGRTVAEIAALADSVYVSLYKTLGGLGGCVIAAEPEVLAETRPWTTRHGGNVFTVFPYVLAAREGLRSQLPRVPGYCARAHALAAALARIPGVALTTDPPHTNAFGLHLPGTPDRLSAANQRVAESAGVWLFDRFSGTPLPGRSLCEVTVGEATEELTDAEAAGLVARLIELAGDPA